MLFIQLTMRLLADPDRESADYLTGPGPMRIIKNRPTAPTNTARCGCQRGFVSRATTMAEFFIDGLLLVCRCRILCGLTVDGGNLTGRHLFDDQPKRYGKVTDGPLLIRFVRRNAKYRDIHIVINHIIEHPIIPIT